MRHPGWRAIITAFPAIALAVFPLPLRAWASAGGDVRKLDLATGKVVGTAAIPDPGNASRTADGRLPVAGVATDHEPMASFAQPDASRPTASDVYAMDVGTLWAERIFTHEGTAVNAAIVAVQAGPDLLIGSRFGDAVVAVRNAFGAAR